MDSLTTLVMGHDIDTIIAYSSPLLYMIYVEIAKIVLPRENEKNKQTIQTVKMAHNLGLSIASLLLFIGINYAAYESGKLNSVHAALCHVFRDEQFAYMVGRYFYLSKYWEWLDTAFLIIGGKPITWLQYTHHMSTAILVYANIRPIISAASFLACFTNTFVHIFMYLYFAFPRGALRPFRQGITILQIIQHCCCLSGFTYIYFNLAKDCYSTPIGIQMALALYVMYLTFFLFFYIVQYVRKDAAGTKKKK
mmetsp:Transcript_2236/g.3517  ORF Transcript_2236/g.3517 Transcript_2236/m.3517 type:complete len:251 (-) Transcript_2236:110-862(-)